MHSNTPSQNRYNGLFQDIIYQNKGHYWGTVKVVKGGRLRHGFGKYNYRNGGFYDGQWSEDHMHGYGKLYYPGGQLAYQGEWVND